MDTKEDLEAWIAVAERAVAQEQDAPEGERLCCRTLVRMVLPTLKKVAEVLS